MVHCFLLFFFLNFPPKIPWPFSLAYTALPTSTLEKVESKNNMLIECTGILSLIVCGSIIKKRKEIWFPRSSSLELQRSTLICYECMISSSKICRKVHSIQILQLSSIRLKYGRMMNLGVSALQDDRAGTNTSKLRDQGCISTRVCTKRASLVNFLWSF